MTREEFMAAYGDVKVRFSNYYKFTFTFTGVSENGDKVSCDVGGNSDVIYRLNISSDCEESVRDIGPYGAGAYRDGEEVAYFYDY